MKSSRSGNLGEGFVDFQAAGLANADHFVGAGRGAADTQDGVAFFEQAYRDGVENFVEGIVADFF